MAAAFVGMDGALPESSSVTTHDDTSATIGRAHSEAWESSRRATSSLGLEEMVYGQRRGPLPPHSSSARSSGSWVARSDLPPGPPTWPPDSQHGSPPKGDGNNAVRNPLETVTDEEEDVLRAAAFQVSEPVVHTSADSTARGSRAGSPTHSP